MVDLPPEIILLIADHLPNQRECLRLLLVCRDWYSLLLPKAYEHVYLRGNDTIYRFASSIQKNPRIGLALRSLCLDWHAYNPYNPGPLMELDVQSCQDLLKQASPTEEYRAKWEEDLSRGCADAWLAVIAPYLESVTEMTITYGGCSEHFFQMVARATTKEAPFDSQPGLQRLESLNLQKDYDASKAPAYCASEFLPFVHLPAMRKMAFETLGEENRNSHWTFSKPGPGTTNIRELEFGMSNGTYGFGDIITSCAGLESLHYHHEDFVTWGEQTWDFHPYEFYKSLSTQKHSLQVLRLHDNGDYNYMGCQDDDLELDPEYKRFGSLAEFTRLRDIRMPLKTLLQFGMTEKPSVSLEEVLPPSLEHLKLVHYGEEYFDAIAGGLASMALEREKFPKLKRVEIKPVIMWHGDNSNAWKTSYIIPQWFHDQFASIKLLFEEHGIEFEIVTGSNHLQPWKGNMRATLNELFYIRV